MSSYRADRRRQMCFYTQKQSLLGADDAVRLPLLQTSTQLFTRQNDFFSLATTPPSDGVSLRRLRLLTRAGDMCRAAGECCRGRPVDFLWLASRNDWPSPIAQGNMALWSLPCQDSSTGHGYRSCSYGL
jgi:hypothetical protein